jgi:phasin family protein
MANPTADNVAKSVTDNLAKGGQAAGKILQGGTDAMVESGKGSTAAMQELTKAYQELAKKNIQKLTDALHALSDVKSPTDFIALQQRLIRESVEAAVSDSKRIGELTTNVFTAALKPIQERVTAATAAQKTVQS